MNLFYHITSAVLATAVPDLPPHVVGDGEFRILATKAERKDLWDATKLGEFVDQTCLTSAPDYSKLDALFDGTIFKKTGPNRWKHASTSIQIDQFQEACGCIVIAPIATSPSLGDELFEALQRVRGNDFLGVFTTAEGFKYAKVQTEEKNEVQVSWDFPAPPEAEGVRFVAVFSNLPGQCKGEMSK